MSNEFDVSVWISSRTSIALGLPGSFQGVVVNLIRDNAMNLVIGGQLIYQWDNGHLDLMSWN